METGNMMDWSHYPFFHALDLKQAHVRHGEKFNDEVWERKRMGVGPFFFFSFHLYSQTCTSLASLVFGQK